MPYGSHTATRFLEFHARDDGTCAIQRQVMHPLTIATVRVGQHING
jgi:hypothetical protein